MPLPITEVIVAGASLASLIFGGGLFKLYIQHVKDLAVQKHDLDQLKKERAKDSQTITQLTTDIALLNQTLTYLRDALKPLESLPTLVTGFAVQTSEIKAIKEALARLETAHGGHNAD